VLSWLEQDLPIHSKRVVVRGDRTIMARPPLVATSDPAALGSQPAPRPGVTSPGMESITRKLSTDRSPSSS
jgi:hypothetical protein